MALVKTIPILNCVRRARSACLNHGMRLDVLFHFSPELRLETLVLCIDEVIGGASQEISGVFGVTTNDVLVIAMELGKSLLQDRRPQGAVLGYLGENCAWYLLPCLIIPDCLGGEIVIDNYSVWNTEGVEVDSVGTRSIQLWFIVEEKTLHSAWLLSECRGCREEPTVAKLSLINVLMSNTIATPEILTFFKECGSSMPREITFIP